jgi:hypothetical protein
MAVGTNRARLQVGMITLTCGVVIFSVEKLEVPQEIAATFR